ncbi:biotin--[acetyl-CoA-carboxylase] ligase [Rhodoferax sp.]|uniref:biotin--[acetyl-CoA-carboxylase] ligase n=1 Tax=Rhodoferax sp. TaxID=50421 RepID=UPI0037840BE2
MHWPAEAIWEQVAPGLPGFTVEILSQIDSTNTELMRRARAGQAAPVLLVAERQTAGRGRLGRSWHSDTSGDHRTLAFSLGMALAPADWSGLSLAVGVSLARSLHPSLKLKWPNDIWLGDRKLAGILIETAQVGVQRYAVVGVGINIEPVPAEGLRTPPAALAELLPAATAASVLEQVVAPLVRDVLAFEHQLFAPLRPAFTARDHLLGRAVECSDGTVGTAGGVDEAGALLVHTASGPLKIRSAEVSVRPATPTDSP